jgi:peptidoglycan hydrolase-like protein with peptidoglycan-binding domain
MSIYDDMHSYGIAAGLHGSQHGPMDQLVLDAQKWVNSTYGAVSGYTPCPEDGITGWDTMYCLTQALQYELGITALSDNFGPTTYADLQAYGPVGPDSGNINMRIIAEAALYCKGYSGGALDGGFDSDTCAGLASMLSDIGGLTPSVPNSVDPKVFKAMLNMDAYVLVEGGTAMIQTCQRWLNRAYYAHGEYFIGPCDGNYSRNVQESLVLGIQYQMGLTDSQVTGALGPATENALQDEAFVTTGSVDPGTTGWVRLFQCAVAFNGYDCEWGDSGGTYTSDLATTVEAFQTFARLTASGSGDYQTWMSLLVSTGDPTRKGTAFDCETPLTTTTVQTVVNNGYSIVGRYLTGGAGKALTSEEMVLIFGNGLSLFPIYQLAGDELSDFSYDLGVTAATNAYEAATALGIPFGTVIYFAVDYDATDDDIASAIIPHFQGIQATMSAIGGPQYAVGVYGTRNTCSTLYAQGLATRSFASDMSTGYSGNLGFPLPDNWAFDQIATITLDEGENGAVEIDNDLASGWDPGLKSVTTPSDPNANFYTYLTWLEARGDEWIDQGNNDWSASELAAQYLRALDSAYLGTEADLVFGSLDQGFVNYANSRSGMPANTPLRDPNLLWDVDTSHFGACFGGVVNHGLISDLTSANVADFGSWGGDLVTVLGAFMQSGLSDDQAYEFAASKIGNKGTATFFSLGDLLADMDSWLFGLIAVANAGVSLTAAIQENYATPATAVTGLQNFYSVRFGSSQDTLLAAATSAMTGGETDMAALRDAFWADEYKSITCPSPEFMSDASVNGVATAFRDFIVQLCS